jgi:hypothetical protein
MEFTYGVHLLSSLTHPESVGLPSLLVRFRKREILRDGIRCEKCMACKRDQSLEQPKTCRQSIAHDGVPTIEP